MNEGIRDNRAKLIKREEVLEREKQAQQAKVQKKAQLTPKQMVDNYQRNKPTGASARTAFAKLFESKKPE